MSVWRLFILLTDVLSSSSSSYLLLCSDVLKLEFFGHSLFLHFYTFHYLFNDRFLSLPDFKNSDCKVHRCFSVVSDLTGFTLVCSILLQLVINFEGCILINQKNEHHINSNGFSGYNGS